MYEFATDDQQKYKEGKVILERSLVTEMEGKALVYAFQACNIFKKSHVLTGLDEFEPDDLND